MIHIYRSKLISTSKSDFLRMKILGEYSLEEIYIGFPFVNDRSSLQAELHLKLVTTIRDQNILYDCRSGPLINIFFLGIKLASNLEKDFWRRLHKIREFSFRFKDQNLAQFSYNLGIFTWVVQLQADSVSISSWDVENSSSRLNKKSENRGLPVNQWWYRTKSEVARLNNPVMLLLYTSELYSLVQACLKLFIK